MAIVVNSFPKLSESFIYNKVRMLSKSGYSVTIITHSSHNDLNLFRKEELSGVQVVMNPIAVPLQRGFLRLAISLLRYSGEMFRLLRYLSKRKFTIKEKIRFSLLYLPFLQKFDIIHFSFSGLAVSYLPLLPLLKEKALLYVSCRGHAEQIRPMTDFQRKSDLRVLFATVDRVHCVSEDILHTCKEYGLDATKAFVNRPAIDASLFQPENDINQSDQPIINLVSVGRLHWKKAHESLLLMLCSLLSSGANAHLFIVGDGPEREKLVFMSHLLELDKHVTFTGRQTQEQIRNLLAKCHIYVHGSISEGISNAVMEAMAMELPVVSCDVGGMSELIRDGEDGLLVPALQPAQMAEKLLVLWNDINMRHTIGKAARRKIIADFTIDRQCRVYLQEYSSILTQKNSSINSSKQM